MEPPGHIQNVAQWQKNCRKVRARAIDLIDGRIGVIDVARTLSKLAYWAGLSQDDDLNVFVAIDSETDTFPMGEVRQYWSADALEREDSKIRHAENLYRQVALEAAGRLVERFAWVLDARIEQRHQMLTKK